MDEQFKELHQKNGNKLTGSTVGVDFLRRLLCTVGGGDSGSSSSLVSLTVEDLLLLDILNEESLNEGSGTKTLHLK